LFPALYTILDATQDASDNAPLARILAGAGVELIQIRDKKASARKIYDLSRKLAETLDPDRVRLIVNDRPDIAAMAGAGGVHVGQEDLPVEAARKICGNGSWVGVSTHNLEQVRAADRSSADYVAVGPIFLTATKENPDPAVGLELLRAAREITKKPLVAIGGITIESAEAVYRTGADSVAVVRDLISARDPAQRVREYLAIAAFALSHRAGPA
jgi:thiamine-phosphate pyrophosphorylase